MFLKSCAVYIEGSALSFLLHCRHQHLLLSLPPGLPGKGSTFARGLPLLLLLAALFPTEFLGVLEKAEHLSLPWTGCLGQLPSSRDQGSTVWSADLW